MKQEDNGGNPPGLCDHNGGHAGPGDAAGADQPVEDDDEQRRLVRQLQDRLHQQDQENANLLKKMESLESKIQDRSPDWNDSWWPNCNGASWEEGWDSFSSGWQGQASSSGNSHSGRSGRGGDWGQDRGGRGRGRPPRHHRATGVDPGIYKAEAIGANSAQSKFRACTLTYHSEITGADNAFLSSPTELCRHCNVPNWAAPSPDGIPTYGAEFPFGQIEEEDWKHYLSNIAKSVSDWNSAGTRAHSFAVSLWMRNYLTDQDQQDLSNRFQRGHMLWKPALLADPPHKGEEGWLCLWYKDTKNVTLFCRHCKRSSGFVRCDKARDKNTTICNGHEDRDNDYWPVLAGSNLDHQRWVRALITNVTGVRWTDTRDR